MNTNILYFDGAGVDNTSNNLGNCRIRTAFKNDDGRAVYLELTSYTVHKYYDHKKNRRYREYPAGTELGFISHCFYITGGHDDENKNRIDIENEPYVSYEPMIYDAKNILALVNSKLNCSFTGIEVLTWLSGYTPFDGSGGHNMANDFINIPARTAERVRVYEEVAKEYFDEIYQNHIKNDPKAARLYKPRYSSHVVMNYTDHNITIRSHTYKELIDDAERVKTFDINY